MKNFSIYHGIKTNNLKNIDFKLEHNKISLLLGNSGSGKSSLAIETIYKTSLNELSQLMSLQELPSNFIIKDYINILPSIALIQKNFNKNPRSTIATYFKLDTYFKHIFSQINNVPTSLFQFNKFSTSCQECKGLGYFLYPDAHKIIDYSSKIKDVPFRNWKSTYENYYSQLINEFCIKNNIDPEIYFSNLSKENQEKLFYGYGDEKYKINFKINGRKRVKTSSYKGPLHELTNNNLTQKDKKYCSKHKCTMCNGYKFSTKVLTYKVYDKNIGELYEMETRNLKEWILTKEYLWTKIPTITTSFKQIVKFLNIMIDLNIEYLNLNRTIPSLSGGELQRLRFAKAINSQFMNFLYIFDEPSSGLHVSEWNTLLKSIKKIKNQNSTILIIEHNEIFKEISDHIFILGGKDGGELINKNTYLETTQDNPYKFYESQNKIKIINETINNIKNLSTNIQKDCTLTTICGKSGSGKTSFLKYILPKYFNNSTYLDQSPIKGNSYSTVASYLGVFDEIKNLFAQYTKKNSDIFSFHYSALGKCEKCNGNGVLKDEISESILLCPKCDGKRFNNQTLKYKFKNLNIYDFLNLKLDELIKILPKDMKKTHKVISFLQYINLGYLSLFRELSTLSGGESQRIKLCSLFFKYKKSRTFLLDEPFKGLDNESKTKLIKFFYKIIEENNNIFVVEHDLTAIKNASYIIEFGPSSGRNGGTIIYNGTKDNIKKSQKSIIKQYIIM